MLKVLLFFLANSVYSHGLWTQYLGCYITKEVNGKKIKEELFWNDGGQKFKPDKAFAVLDKDNKEVSTLSYYMYAEGSDLGIDVLPIEIFQGLGKTQKDSKTLQYEYKGRLPYKLKNNVWLDYDQKLTWKKITASEFEVEGHLNFSVYKGDKKVHYKYKAKLEKVYCNNKSSKRMNILQPLKQ